MTDELWHAAQSLPIEEQELPGLDEHQAAQLAAWPQRDGSWRVAAVQKPGLPEWAQQQVREFVTVRVFGLLASGPEADGWFKRASDDGWQLTMRFVPPEAVPDTVPADWT